MVSLTRLAGVILGALSVELWLLPWLPGAERLVDLLLLLFLFLGLTLPSIRFLWALGFGLGILKDLISSGPLGAFGISFALVGWILSRIRHLLEREDPILQGVWAGISIGIHGLIYQGWVALVDPMIDGGFGPGSLPGLQSARLPGSASTGLMSWPLSGLLIWPLSGVVGWPLMGLPISMFLGGILAAWGFPRLNRFLVPGRRQGAWSR